MQVQPYLAFEGRCDEAIEFYKKAIGAKVEMLMRFKEAPDQSMISPGSADKVMHAALRAGDATILMSDGRCTGNPNFHGIALALSASTDAGRRTHLQRAGRGRQSEYADGEDILLVPLRHAVRQIRRRLDGSGRAIGTLGEFVTVMMKPLAEREITITRTFDAPRALVFKAWTDAKMLAQWWGPQGFTNPRCEFDAKVGGVIRIDMRAPDGAIYPMQGEVREIVPPERLVFTNMALDANGNAMTAGLTTVTFADEGGKTKLTLHTRGSALVEKAIPYLQGMEYGWGQSIDKLADLLTRGA